MTNAEIKSYALVSSSAFISADDLEAIAALSQFQIFAHYAPSWKDEPVPVTAFASADDAPVDATILEFTDADPPEEGVLAYHTEDASGRKLLFVYAAVLAKNGAKPLTGPYNALMTALHEMLEAKVDPGCNDWIDGAQTRSGSEWSKEVVDPVEAQFYPAKITVGEKTFEGDLPNFVLPEYFDNAAIDQPVCYMAANGLEPADNSKLITGCFQIAAASYAVVRNGPGTEQQIFADITPPQWRIDLKRKTGRVAHRLLHDGDTVSVEQP